MPSPSSLESVIATAQLAQRDSRPADLEGEARITRDLLRLLAAEPQGFFPKLVQAVLDLTGADSAGISLLDESLGKFVWPSVVGGLAQYIGAGTPSDFGPCGTVLERNAPVLFIHPENYFGYLEPITPPLEEVLLTPFHLRGKAVGTIWAVIHEEGKNFDREDLRLLQNLSTFAASAYRVLVDTGGLKAILDDLPPQPETRPMTHNEGSWRFVDKKGPAH